VFKRLESLWVILAVALLTVGATMGTAIGQKAATPKPTDKLALAEPEVKQLLLLMDADKNGKISKQEWMRFMDAEFDRLDKDKKGELDDLRKRRTYHLDNYMESMKTGWSNA
jgi:EF hand